jgi:hypothetical protein
MGVHCFAIEGREANWHICGTSVTQKAQVEAFRQQVILHVIRSSGKEQFTALLLTEPLYDDVSQWNWVD